CVKAQKTQRPNAINQQEKDLLPFVGNPRKEQPQGIKMRLTDYLDLVDDTGRILRDDKRGHINANADKILKRLNIAEDKWLQMTSEFEICFHSFVGNESNLRKACEQLNYQRPSGLTACQRMFH
ncbi:MAG: transposase, partial [Bermanella sp.]